MMRVKMKMRDGAAVVYKVTDETCWAMMKDFWTGLARIYDTLDCGRIEINWARVVQLANIREPGPAPA